MNLYRKPFLVLVIALCLSLLAQAVGTAVLINISSDTNTVVNDVKTRNSPEAKSNQEQRLEEIILRVDCNSRKALEDALNDISVENPGLYTKIRIVPENCTSVTTTTVP